MPTYTFRNSDTDEIIEQFMSISEREPFLENNPHLKQVPTAPAIVDPINIGVTKPPSDFQKHVLGRIKATQPGASEVANRRWGIPREI
jgi:hypothetical protein